MVIGLLTLDLHFPGARSLKDKRQALRSLETKLRNRLNVAVSRAQCLAYLVCSPALLESRATNVDEMRLISTLCALVEEAELQTGAAA